MIAAKAVDLNENLDVAEIDAVVKIYDFATSD